MKTITQNKFYLLTGSREVCVFLLHFVVRIWKAEFIFEIVLNLSNIWIEVIITHSYE